uniref:Uncharacterized protein n=1 Tax=Fagus sylvatica TaxID=28930 RepID=A0A2N9FBY3_FAGSY
MASSASPPSPPLQDNADAERRLREAEDRLREAIEELQRRQRKIGAARGPNPNSPQHKHQHSPPCCDHAAYEPSCVANAIGNICQSFLLSYGVRVGIGILLRAFKLARRHSYSSLLDLKRDGNKICQLCKSGRQLEVRNTTVATNNSIQRVRGAGVRTHHVGQGTGRYRPVWRPIKRKPLVSTRENLETSSDESSRENRDADGVERIGGGMVKLRLREKIVMPVMEAAEILGDLRVNSRVIYGGDGVWSDDNAGSSRPCAINSRRNPRWIFPKVLYEFEGCALSNMVVRRAVVDPLSQPCCCCFDCFH